MLITISCTRMLLLDYIHRYQPGIRWNLGTPYKMLKIPCGQTGAQGVRGKKMWIRKRGSSTFTDLYSQNESQRSISVKENSAWWYWSHWWYSTCRRRAGWGRGGGGVSVIISSLALGISGMNRTGKSIRVMTCHGNIILLTIVQL